MKFDILKSCDAHDIKQLFTDVFTSSEGEDEGELIGNLAFELQETTHPDDLFGFSAKDGMRIIGCIFFSRLKFEVKISSFILSPVAIATQYQKKGIGQKLIKFGISHLKKKHVKLIFTYGDPKFYSKTGFRHIPESLVKAPLKLTYPEGWLAQSLVSDHLKPISGSSCCVPALNNQKYW